MKRNIFKLMTLAFVFFLMVGCGGSSNGDNTDTGDSGDTTADTGDTTEPADTGDTDEGKWEAKYKKADGHADKVSKDVVKANNDLGMKLFSALASEEPGKNMMISPLSISIAMAMVTNGASGENYFQLRGLAQNERRSGAEFSE